jgi:chemotaxis protein CheD
MSIDLQATSPAKVLVEPAKMVVSKNPDGLLCTSPLGAGLGIAIYDPAAKVGGVMHCLLPASDADPVRAATRPGMFLDTGLPALFEAVQELHGTTNTLRIFVAGAAQMIDDSSNFDLGRINHESLVALLKERGCKIHAQAVGGHTNCSMELDLATGEARVKYCGQNTSRPLCKP